jgi:hypothetical protein
MSSADLPYDYEDLGLTAQELALKYVELSHHPEYDSLKWIQSTTSLSYWEWVVDQISKDDEAY